MTASISVVLATHNGARFLEQQLESLERQSLRPCELIVSDDCSKDETLNIVSSFSARASFPIKVMQNVQKKGYRSNFMDASVASEGDIVAFCDQDDIWRPDKLERVADAFRDPEILLVHHNARLVDEGGRAIGEFRPYGALPAISPPLTYDPWFFPYGLCQAFRRNLVRWSDLREITTDFYFEEERLAHDQWYFFLATTLGTIAYIDECLVDYRQHASNAYGLTKVQGVVERISVMIQVGGPTFLKRSNSISSKLDVLRRMGERLSTEPELLLSVARAIEVYEQFAARSALRAGSYVAEALPRRARYWLGLIRDGAYESRAPWCFGPRSMLRDALLGVLIGSKERTSEA